MSGVLYPSETLTQMYTLKLSTLHGVTPSSDEFDVE